MITAEEKLKANFFNGKYIEINSGDFEDVKNLMIEFAKLHVEAQAKAILESFDYFLLGKEYIEKENIKDSILNAYPLKNIT